jgi:plasmid stability protein
VGTITVRNLDDGVQRRLRQRAAANNRSMEAEVREILASAVPDDGAFLHSWLELAATHRGDPLPLPERSRPRSLDLS